MTTATSEIAAKGFLRFPNAWLRLDLSPGAKCLLMQFCASADDSGASWYSYAQLTAVVNRSRASIAAYVRELRDAGLIATEQQRMANGFNYRLRVRVIGWTEIIAGWRKPAMRRQAERSDQPIERPNPTGSKNHINKIHLTTTENKVIKNSETYYDFPKRLEMEWQRCLCHNNDQSFTTPPTIELLKAVIKYSENLNRNHCVLKIEEAKNYAKTELEKFIIRRELQYDSDNVRAAAAVFAARLRSRPGIAAAIGHLDRTWPAHWRRLSSSEQIERWLNDEMRRNPRCFEDLTLVWRFRDRARRAHAELRRRLNDRHEKRTSHQTSRRNGMAASIRA